ncbi:cupredoxin domain-containing protein [Thermoflavimicrobium dichotomicum]|uniref:Cupredoxin-like domain-containing protein n=1 Tax=Thermoflavimicrobium dichotomicum TaxID=46223 RepID=A0A1I3PMW5_9BACL|nr:cupredoxin domain-containing protein [Thermoflavimicrobium dichotomicum]SFJ22651.1 Cupredoxin-like domain-containing protein [Thermoflavimicrobium dichotomicum]
MRLSRFYQHVSVFAFLLLFAIPAYAAANPLPVRDVHLFTVEYKTKINGQEAEVYRWDPGQIIVKKGETVALHLHGFHGKEHAFSIPKLQIKGKVKKGETTTVTFQAKEPGTYELICHNHYTHQQHGPMIGYITVVN